MAIQVYPSVGLPKLAAEANIISLPTDLSNLQTQTALQQAYLAVRTQADLGYYAYGAGQLVLSPNATPTKLDMTAGTMFTGLTNTELNVAAQTAIATTIASMADSTNPKWVVVELQTTGVVLFNQGTAAANPSFPTFTSGRMPLGFLYIPANATTVDTALTTNNGNAKLITAQIYEVQHQPRRFYTDTAGTVVTNATSFTTLLSAAPTIPANSLNVGDTLRLRASGVMLLHTTTVVTFQILVGAHDAMVIATASLAADTSNTRKWLIDAEMICSATGSTANFKCNARQGVTISSANSNVGLADDQVQSLSNLVAGSQDNTSGLVLDLQFKNTTSDAATTCTLHGCSIIKYPA